MGNNNNYHSNIGDLLPYFSEKKSFSLVFHNYEKKIIISIAVYKNKSIASAIMYSTNSADEFSFFCWYLISKHEKLFNYVHTV